MKIPFLAAKLFHENGQTDRQTDGHYEVNSRFSQFCERASKCVSCKDTCSTTL